MQACPFHHSVCQVGHLLQPVAACHSLLFHQMVSHLPISQLACPFPLSHQMVSRLLISQPACLFLHQVVSLQISRSRPLVHQAVSHLQDNLVDLVRVLYLNKDTGHRLDLVDRRVQQETEDETYDAMVRSGMIKLAKISGHQK